MTDLAAARTGKSPLRSLVVLLAVLALSAFACGSEDVADDGGGGTDAGGGGGTAGGIEVVATDFQFDTSEIEVEPGATLDVALTNDGENEHTFTVEELDVEVEVEPGEEGETSFEAPDEDATYEFLCEFHPDQMRGELIVGAGGDAPAGGGESEKEKEDEDEPKGGYDY